MRVVLLGLAGAGKGTQAQVLAQRLGVPNVSSGDLFRHHQSQGTKLGLLAKEYIERGELVPDEVTVQMVLERIDLEDCQKGFILDGFPRTLQQALTMDEALGKGSVDCVVYIKVSEEELVRRLSGRVSCRLCGAPYQQAELGPAKRCSICGGQLYQRADDLPKVVQNRIRVQRPELNRLVDYYAAHGKLVEVKGEQRIEGVTKEILKAVSKCVATR